MIGPTFYQPSSVSRLEVARGQDVRNSSCAMTASSCDLEDLWRVAIRESTSRVVNKRAKIDPTVPI